MFSQETKDRCDGLSRTCSDLGASRALSTHPVRSLPGDLHPGSCQRRAPKQKDPRQRARGSEAGEKRDFSRAGSVRVGGGLCVPSWASHGVA